MFQESELRSIAKQRFWLVLPSVCFGVLALFACLGLIALFRSSVINWAKINFGAVAENWIMLPLVASAIVCFLVPLLIAEQKAKHYGVKCPKCSKDLTHDTQRILKTRCCSGCGKRIVERGRIRSNETYSRYCRQQSRRYLVYWFWAWPACGVLMLLWHFIDPASFRDCPHMVFLFGLVGTFATGWTLIRTRDLRYLPQAVTSAIVFWMGLFVFLQ